MPARRLAAQRRPPGARGLGLAIEVDEGDQAVELEIGKEAASRSGTVPITHEDEHEDATVLPDPDLMHAETAVHLELRDPATGQDHFDGEIGMVRPRRGWAPSHTPRLTSARSAGTTLFHEHSPGPHRARRAVSLARDPG